MKVCCRLSERFALSKIKYFSKLLSSRYEESSINLPGTREQADEHLEVRFVTIYRSKSQSQAKYVLESIAEAQTTLN